MFDMRVEVAPVMAAWAELPGLVAQITGDEKHGAAANSTLDVLWVLHTRVLRLGAQSVRDPDRDRFVLSKGHGPASYYAVLAATGFFAKSELNRFERAGSILGRHPDRLLVPGVEVSSGSLGHGLPIAVGMASALRLRAGRSPRVVCLVGDGELDEGSMHEAIAYAGRVSLNNLTVVLVDNGSSRWGWPGGPGRRFEIEGWHVLTVDGRDHDALAGGLADQRDGRPHAVVATVHPPVAA